MTFTKPIGMLIDVTRCRNCGECVRACVEANHLDPQAAEDRLNPDGLSANRWSAVIQSPEGRYVRRLCRHCLEPACVSVCPVGAMQKTPAGPVIYDANRCMGCRYCMMACPFGIPRYDWHSTAPRVQKCTFCWERLQQGELPACAEACPHQVMQVGEREALLAQAHQRLQAEPERYLPLVYGETEVGGTSVLYLSDVPLDFLRLPVANPVPGDKPLPELSAAWLEKVPPLSLSVAAAMTGLFYLIGRRMQMDEARRQLRQKEVK